MNKETLKDKIQAGGLASYIPTKHVKQFIKDILEEFDLWRLHQFGIGIGMSPKFGIFKNIIKQNAGFEDLESKNINKTKEEWLDDEVKKAKEEKIKLQHRKQDDKYFKGLQNERL